MFNNVLLVFIRLTNETIQQDFTDCKPIKSLPALSLITLTFKKYSNETC